MAVLIQSETPPAAKLQCAWSLAWKMLAHNRLRLLFTVLGVGAAFFLAAAQFGLLVGWVKSTPALITHADVDLWIMEQKTQAWDVGQPISRQYVYRARSFPDVSWAQPVLVAWVIWYRDDGEDVSAQLVGLDHDGVGGPWQMQEGELRVIHKPETVVIDERYQDMMQIHAIGETAQILGRHVVVGGFSKGVRSFTATPPVFASLKQALIYAGNNYRADEVTYVSVRIRPGADVNAVRENMRRSIENVDILTSDEFAERTARYWMLTTGAGIAVIFTALLGLVVGAVITSQTLFTITQENLAHYATLMAVGFERRLLTQVVLLQSALVGVAGIVIGTVLYVPVSWLSQYSQLMIEFYWPMYIALVVIFLIICVLASGLSLRSVFRLDPVVVFSQQ